MWNVNLIIVLNVLFSSILCSGEHKNLLLQSQMYHIAYIINLISFFLNHFYFIVFHFI